MPNKPQSVQVVYEDRPILRIVMDDPGGTTVDFELRWSALTLLAKQTLNAYDCARADLKKQAEKAIAEFPAENIKRKAPSTEDWTTPEMRQQARDIIRRFL